jgi:hypothetical protein
MATVPVSSTATVAPTTEVTADSVSPLTPTVAKKDVTRFDFNLLYWNAIANHEFDANVFESQEALSRFHGLRTALRQFLLLYPSLKKDAVQQYREFDDDCPYVTLKQAVNSLITPYAGFCETYFVKPFLQPLLRQLLPSTSHTLRSIDVDVYEVQPALTDAQWKQMQSGLQQKGRTWLVVERCDTAPHSH